MPDLARSGRVVLADGDRRRSERKADVEKIKAQAVFDNAEQRKRVMHVYEEAIETLEKRLKK